MTESLLHEFVKNSLADAFSKKGFKVETEKISSIGIHDLMVSNNGETYLLEVIHTHTPKWFGIKITSKTKRLECNCPVFDFSEKLTITMQKSVSHSLDQIRGDVPRSTFLSKLVREYSK